jgi:wax ester synthase-like acyl-CoA acyltransferase family protein
MHLLPRYRQRLIFAPFNLARPSLEDDPAFDLDDHIHCHELPKDCGEAATRLFESPLDRDRRHSRFLTFCGRPGTKRGPSTYFSLSLAPPKTLGRR